MSKREALPGPADVAYITRAQAAGWGDMLRAFARFVGDPTGWLVLDVGAGPGLLPRLCAANGARLAVSCDDSWPMVQKAAALSTRGPELALLAAGALHLPVATGSCDAVLATNLLFLLPEPDQALAEFVRVARPGGIVAFLNPTDRLDPDSAAEYASERGMEDFDRFSFVNFGRLASEHRRLSAAQWLALAVEAGLVDLRSASRAGGLAVFVGGRKATAASPTAREA